MENKSELTELRARVAALERQTQTQQDTIRRLGKSERMFRALAESMHANVLIANIEEERCIYANPAAIECTGYTFEELTGYPPIELLTPESLRQRDAAAAAYISGHPVPRLMEMELVTKSGDIRTVETSWEVIDLGEDGLFKVITSFDITDRKRAEEALLESERRFRALADVTPAMISITVGDGDRFAYANKALLDSVGLSWEAFSKINPRESLSQAALEAGNRAAKDAFEKNEGDLRFEYQTEEGSWMEVSAIKTIIDGEEAVIWTAFDITEHKQAQEALAKSEERYRAIFNTAGTAMVIFGDDKVITLANDEWVKLSGYSKEETEGKLTWAPFFTEASLVRMLEYHEKRSADPAAVPRAYEAEFISRGGEVHQGVLIIEMIPGTSQRVASFQDMTELKRAEQQMYQADKMAALGQIIAGVAHEINNPNNFIYFNLPILKRYIEAMRPMLEHHLEDEPDLKILNMPYTVFLEDVFKLLENMEHGSKRITGIVSELKNYIRSDDAKQFKEASIESVIDRLMALIGKQVRKMVQRFDVTVAPNLPRLRMNPGKIEQVLINLVINAGQASDKADAFVALECLESTTQEGYLEIRISDNGCGIPRDIRDQIFEPFFTTKSREAGTGLGLSISHRIIEEHGGILGVESEEGRGTCFTIHLPTVRNR